MRTAGNVACMREMGNTYSILILKREEKEAIR